MPSVDSPQCKLCGPEKKMPNLPERKSAKAKGRKAKGWDAARTAALRDMILEIVGEADHDLAKSFDPELSEDPEDSERTMEKMVEIAGRHIAALEKRC